MLFTKLLNFLRGYLLIKIEGYLPEKFINIATRRDMFLWDTAKMSRKLMQLKISIRDFRHIRQVAKKSRCKVKIVKRYGLPFILHRYRKRKMLLTGVLIFIALFYVMTSFIWVIEVNGDEGIDKDQIVRKLEENGIKSGTFKYMVNYEDLAKKLQLEMKEYSWIGISMKGTKLKVSVEKSVEKPQIIPKNEPCNLVATRDGIITSVTVKFGEQRVAVGDTVIKGQTLISGEIISKDPKEAPRYVHPIGTVKARTWYEDEEIVQTKIPYKERTGNDKKVFSFKFFSSKVTLTPGRVKFDDYDLTTDIHKLSFGENLIFPFEIIVDTYDENVIKYREIDIEEAKKEALQKTLSKIYSKLPPSAVIMDTNTEFIQNNDGQMKVNVIMECIEEVSTEMKMP